MNCEKIKLLVHDYHHNLRLQNNAAKIAVDEYAQSCETVDLHLQHCSGCKDFFRQYNQLEVGLRAISKLKTPASLRQRILSDRVERDGHNNLAAISKNRSIFYPAAFAASVCLIVIGALLVNLTDDRTSSTQTTLIVAKSVTVNTQQSSISAVINKLSKVNFLVNSTWAINNVTFTLSVPPHMALHGYAGQHSLSWNGKLKQGKNLLTVPVMALTEQPGVLIMKITHNNSIREYKVAVNVRQNRVMGPIWTSRRLS